MARAQNSYIVGSTSPSSLIQTACFLGATISVAVGVESFTTGAKSVADAVAAMENVARMAKKKKIFAKSFMLPMYKDCFVKVKFFVKKNTLLAQNSGKTDFFSSKSSKMVP